MKKLLLSNLPFIFAKVLTVTFFALKAHSLENDNLPLRQKLMIEAIDRIAGVYLDHYAPLSFKISNLKIDVQGEYRKARASILANPDLPTKDFRRLLTNFVSSFKDYHVQITFYSTEMASLPFSIFGINGKYYLANVDRSRLDENAFPFSSGDEVLEFGNVSIQQAIEDLKKVKVPNSLTTDERLLEANLTARAGLKGDLVPKGSIELKIKKANGTVKSVQTDWNYVPEMVPEVPIRPRPPEMDFSRGFDFKKMADSPLDALVPNDYMGQSEHPLTMYFETMSHGSPDNGFGLGGRTSFVPKLGEVIWKTDSSSPFVAYIFKHATKGTPYGYLRIPSFEGDETKFNAFLGIMKKLSESTDGLVIDELNNPGGSAFYMYAILSTLTDKPLSIPKHRFLISEADAFTSGNAMLQSQAASNGENSKSQLQTKLNGFPVSNETFNQIADFHKFILGELDLGRRLTEPGYLMGVTEIPPHPKVRYTKPMLVLINSLDFSCGDFFPAILQDNNRAVLFGTKTSGAGGAVVSSEFPNQFGIYKLNYTRTLAQRKNGVYIENTGVTPDIIYDISLDDLQNKFRGYADRVSRALLDLFGDPSRL